MILLIDNYDSFTYNLCDYISQLGFECLVVRNDEKSINELKTLDFEAAIISPGPKTPAEAGITMQFIDTFHTTKPILGICLGHQAIGQYFGWGLKKAAVPIHGKTSVINVNNHNFLFKALPAQFEVMRYHSLVLEETRRSFAEITAKAADNGEIMAIQHKTLPLTGVQFHPESILTRHGLQIMHNWFSSVLGHSMVL